MIHPFATRPARRTALGACPPSHTGGYGSCQVSMCGSAPDSCQNSPEKVTDGWVQIAFISSSPSSKRRTRSPKGTPRYSNSSGR